MLRFDRVKDERLRRFCAYWLRARGARVMPSREQIDPVDISFVLAHVWLYDLVPPNRFRCRLAGEDVARLFRPSPRGRFLDEIFSADHGAEVTSRFMNMVERRQGTHTVGPCYLSGERQVFGERITLPLSTDGTTVDALIGATIYDLSVAESSATFLREDHEISYIDVSAPSRDV